MKWVLQQLVVLVLLLIVTFLCCSSYTAGVALGFSIAVLIQFVFTVFAFKYSGARQANSMVNAFYKGESFKFLFAVVLLAIAFSVVDKTTASAALVGYIIGLGSSWLGSVRFISKRSVK